MKFVLTLLVVLLGASQVEAKPICPFYPSFITVPCTISAGNALYRLNGALDGTAGGADSVIDILPGLGFVTIDCNNHRIENSASPWSNPGYGIYSALTANLTVRNCRFAGSGLERCVYIENGASGRAFKTILLEDNTCQATEIGFYVDSDITTLSRNYVVDIGGKTSCFSGNRSFGVILIGDLLNVTDNKIRYVWNRCYLEAVGISFSDRATNVTMTGNEIENDVVPTWSWIAVWLGSNSGPYTISGNKIDKWYYGFVGYTPIAPSTLSGSSLITNVTIPLAISSPPWTITP